MTKATLLSKLLCRTLGVALDALKGGFPAVVRLETTNACNARCVICPHRTMHRPIAWMDETLFARLIDECAASGCREVHLHNFGEPLLDKRPPAKPWQGRFEAACPFEPVKLGLKAGDRVTIEIPERSTLAAALLLLFVPLVLLFGGTLLGNINGLNISVGYLGLLVLPAVVLGGLNSVPGAIVGGIAIGVMQNLCGAYLDQYFPGGVKEIAPFAFMAIFLLFKPYGLWGWERIERV